jgi:shikimate dehydrogenase
VISGETRLVGLIGNPVAASLSPRMQNAAFAALGLEWAYVPLPVERDELADALRGLVAFGFAGANVTAPYKLDVACSCGAAEPSVNTLVVRDGEIEAYSTDAAVLDALKPEGPVVIGDGGAATAFVAALPGATQFSRRADWPAVVDGADLVVNATSERDQVLARLGPGQTLIDLPYPATATARAARESGAKVIGGLDVLVAQGAASFELWTGLPAPVQVMRRALGLPE